MADENIGTQLGRLGDIIASKHLARFAKQMMPAFQSTTFHNTYYELLNEFAHGRIKRLIVTVPPQHGKSLGASQFLPAYMLGLNPDCEIAIASYAFSLATTFNRRVQRVMQDKAYSRVFPKTRLKSGESNSEIAKKYVQTSEIFEVVGHNGCLRSVGRGGGLTGNRVDVAIVDDLYKDAMEANSPTTRANTWEWYNSVLKTRLHNDSRELIVFTRWHEEDIIGMLESLGLVKEISTLSEIDPNSDVYYKVNFEAIKESPPTELDSREMGESLWAEMHNTDTLNDKRKLEPLMFDCLYQGHPGSKEGVLLPLSELKFADVSNLSDDAVMFRFSVGDPADTGGDHYSMPFMSVVIDGDDFGVYVTDVLHSKDGIEANTPRIIDKMSENETEQVFIESNGVGLAAIIELKRQMGQHTTLSTFNSSVAKEVRILSNYEFIKRYFVFDKDYEDKPEYKVFVQHLTRYSKEGTNTHRFDAIDVLASAAKALKVKYKDFLYK